MNKLNQTKSIWVSLLLALTLILGSCSKDFLNTRPVGRVLEVNYYQTEEQAFEALVSIYDVLQWNDQYGFTMFRFLQNVASDDTYAGGSDASDQPSWVAYDNFHFDTEPWSTAWILEKVVQRNLPCQLIP